MNQPTLQSCDPVEWRAHGENPIVLECASGHSFTTTIFSWAKTLPGGEWKVRTPPGTQRWVVRRIDGQTTLDIK